MLMTFLLFLQELVRSHAASESLSGNDITDRDTLCLGALSLLTHPRHAERAMVGPVSLCNARTVRKHACALCAL
jgi:hypothetical protein